MVPSRRLIFWTALAGVPFTLVAGVLPESRPLAFAVLGGLGLAVLADAIISRQRLAGVAIALDEVVRLQKDRADALCVLIRDDRRRTLHLRLGLDLPPTVDSDDETMRIALPKDAPASRTDWHVRPKRRGQFHITRCFIETESRLGFWELRALRPVSCELRVYPNLIDERRNVAALFLARGRNGVRVRRHSGKGRDFEKLREYVAGDSYDEIHWRASAKRGHPVTKIFQIERTQEVYVIIDSSRLSARESAGRGQVLERFLASGLILAMAAQQQGDLFGLITFSDRVERFVRARSGKSHYDACRDALYTLHPRMVSPNFEELAAFIRTRMRKRSLLVVLTALDDPVLADNFVRSVDLIARQHLVLVNMMRPVGAVPLFTGDAVNARDDIHERLGGHLQWHELRELEKVLQRRGVTLRQLTHERMTPDLVSQYLDVKARQLL